MTKCGKPQKSKKRTRSPKRTKKVPVVPYPEDYDMEDIPVEYREAIEKVIQKRVQERMDEEMTILLDEVKDELADVKAQGQIQISEMIRHNRPYTGYEREGRYPYAPYPHGPYGHDYYGYGYTGGHLPYYHKYGYAGPYHHHF